MSSSDFFLWSGWALVLIGAGLTLWAIIGDRSRGRRRCPRCWYSMDGASGLKCPECGQGARHERRLFRTRRRWRWVIVGLLLLAAAWPVRVWPRASRDGWVSVLPTRVVVELFPLGGDKGPLGQELAKRLGLLPRGPTMWQPEVSEQERRYILRRCVTGNWLARPIDDRWRASYGWLLQNRNAPFYEAVSAGPLTTKDGTPADEELVDLVTAQAKLPCVLTCRTRPVWPEGARVYIDMKVETWWPLYIYAYPDGTWSDSARGASGKMRDPIVARPGATLLDLDLNIFQENSKENPRTRHAVQHETSQVSFRTVATMDEAMPPVTGPEIDDLLKRGLYLGFGDYFLDVDARNLAGKGFDDVAFGVMAEIRCGEEVVATEHLRWMGGGYLANVGGTTLGGLQAPNEDAARKRLDASRGQAGWTIRLKTDEEWALDVLDAKRYWRGDVVVPVDWGDGSRRVPPQRPMRPAN